MSMIKSLKKSGIYMAFLSLALLFPQCEEKTEHNGRVPLVAVGDTYLYKDEVDILYAMSGLGTDSVAFYDDYIERWATDALFYSKAFENVASTAEIERMVESYRRSLILSLYQDALINQHLVPEISEAEVQEFYERNLVMFELEEPLVKGLLLKLPEKSPKMNDVRRWCMRRDIEDLENIEKYSISNAAVYESFPEEWRSMNSVVALTPLTLNQLYDRLSQKKTIEFSDGGYIYFVGADTIVPKGGLKPLEMVAPEIVELLVNSKKANFIKEKKRALYNEAQSRGKVKRLDKNASEAAR